MFGKEKNGLDVNILNLFFKAPKAHTTKIRKKNVYN